MYIGLLFVKLTFTLAITFSTVYLVRIRLYWFFEGEYSYFGIQDFFYKFNILYKVEGYTQCVFQHFITLKHDAFNILYKVEQYIQCIF